MHVHCYNQTIKELTITGDNMQHFTCSWLIHPKYYFGAEISPNRRRKKNTIVSLSLSVVLHFNNE